MCTWRRAREVASHATFAAALRAYEKTGGLAVQQSRRKRFTGWRRIGIAPELVTVRCVASPPAHVIHCPRRRNLLLTRAHAASRLSAC